MVGSELGLMESFIPAKVDAVLFPWGGFVDDVD